MQDGEVAAAKIVVGTRGEGGGLTQHSAQERVALRRCLSADALMAGANPT
jgi:hypothetical protein